MIELRSLPCQYPGSSSSRGGACEGNRASEQRRRQTTCSSRRQTPCSSKRQTPCSSQALKGSQELFTQYSPITLAPIAYDPLDDCKLDMRKKGQRRSMPLPKITREDSESGSVQDGQAIDRRFVQAGSVVLTNADVEREEGEILSTAFIFPSETQRVKNLHNSAKLKIQRQRSKSH